MIQSEFVHNTFTPLQTRLNWLVDTIVANVPAGQHTALRFLDLGCGTGEVLFRLASLWPRAQLTGVDLSASSIAVADRQRGQSPFADRMSFHAGDYMEFQAPAFDVIFSWSVLQCIPTATKQLLAKIAIDLRKDGTLILGGIPLACLYNRALYTVRSMARLYRRPWTDRLILRAAKLVHGAAMSEDALQERVGYM